MIYRQGDVLLVPIKELPKTVKKLEDKTLAYGEVTGHSHRFLEPQNIDRYMLGDKRFLEVRLSTPLHHEEHHEQVILPGLYEQIQEREYNYIDEEMQKVVD